MAYKAKAYTLREESTESGIRYFISFKDGQGAVSYTHLWAANTKGKAII